MAECMMESGLRTRCMGREFTCGLMEESMKETTIWIKSMDMECTTGQMEEYMKDFGRTGSNMEKGSTLPSKGL